jgi:CubicO group peptidase (beta-lactamase class C family)
VTDLFAHRSGLSGNAGNDLEGLGFDRDTILSRLHLLEPTSSSRAGYAYSNFGLTDWHSGCGQAHRRDVGGCGRGKLYTPLGMTSTSSRQADFLKHDNRAALHVMIDGKWTVLVKRNPDPRAPAGGVSSNVRDLAQWMRIELANGKFDGKQFIMKRRSRCRMCR